MCPTETVERGCSHAEHWPPCHWPYPDWIAHRGAGRLAPENTLAAFRLGLTHGFRMFECDVRLSADEVPFLLHDEELERTSNGCGRAAAWRWNELMALDAGSWHGAAHAGERLLSLQTLLEFCQREGCQLNLELKAEAGREARTGAVVAAQVQRDWQAAPPPLLSSFSTLALEGAAAAVPSLPRALLLERFSSEALNCARALNCVAVVLEDRALELTAVQAIQAAGLALACYTVNDGERAALLRSWGVAIITDAVDRLGPGAASMVGR